MKLSSSFSPRLSFDQPNFVKLKIEEKSSFGKSNIKEIKEELSKLLDHYNEKVYLEGNCPSQ